MYICGSYTHPQNVYEYVYFVHFKNMHVQIPGMEGFSVYPRDVQPFWCLWATLDKELSGATQ